MKIFKKLIFVVLAAALSVTALSSCNNREPIELDKKDDIVEKQREPGLVCWGGSITYGAYGNSNSYIKTVEDHMMTDECYIPIVNMGVPGESTKTVMARAGALKIVTNAFTIPKNIEPVEISFTAEDKSLITPLRYGTACDGGMTNVTIGGVEGTLAVNSDTAQMEEPTYTFTRKVEGEEIKIKKGEQLISESMTEYVDYIPVVCIGEHGGWKDLNELIKQQQAIINTSKNKDKYLVLGIFQAPATTNNKMTAKQKLQAMVKANEDFDKAMEKQWGDHYVNIREYLCSDKAIERAEELGIKLNEKDLNYIKNKIVPDSFKYDPDNLNGSAYDIIGDIVYEKLVELGYLHN